MNKVLKHADANEWNAVFTLPHGNLKPVHDKLLYKAYKYNNNTAINFLLNNIDFPKENKNKYLIYAVEYNNINKVYSMFDIGANFDNDCEKAITYAIKNNNVEIFNLILDHGFNIYKHGRYLTNICRQYNFHEGLEMLSLCNFA